MQMGSEVVPRPVLLDHRHDGLEHTQRGAEWPLPPLNKHILLFITSCRGVYKSGGNYER